MPEGPQMVFLKEQLESFTGQQVISASGNAKNIPFDIVQGQILSEIRTFGKELLFCFPDFTVRIHLMLFGKYAIDGQLNRELTLGLEFEGGVTNFYACQCRFITQPVDEIYDWSIDVMNVSFSAEKAFEKLKSKPQQLICEALLDQNILAGVGNKIKNEVLFRTQVHPESLVEFIPDKILKDLILECVKLSFQYLEWKQEGSDSEHWEVYKRKECLRNRMPIQKSKIGKSRRSCYFCDKCQNLYFEISE